MIRKKNNFLEGSFVIKNKKLPMLPIQFQNTKIVHMQRQLYP
jgi:hypothetical protein